MRFAPTLLGAVLAVATAAALQAQDAPARDFAVHCGTLHLGLGQEPLRSHWLVVRGGRIAAIQKDAPADLPVVDASDRVVMPGLVAVDSDLGIERDDDYAVTPDVLAIDGFDFEYPLRTALEGGVTTVYLSPGRSRLCSGQGAVVKTAGPDLVQRVLNENACLRLNLEDGGVSAPRVFEPTTHPTDDEPLRPARIQTPTARIALLPEVRALLREAQQQQGLQGPGAAQDQYDPTPLSLCATGKLPVRAAASRAADIARALSLQQEFSLPMVLENPVEIERLAAAASAQGVSAVFRLPANVGRSNPGGEDRSQKGLEPRLDAPAKAAKAGMRIGLAQAPGAPLRDSLLAAGLAVRHGLPPAIALRAIGADAASILGVGDRVGSLEPGKDADFVVLTGEPLAIGTMVESTWIDGRREFARRTEGQVLAIRCGTVLDGTGRTYRDGVLVVQDGRIKAIGEGLPAPLGARVIELPDAVMTPGFVDAYSHLGLAGDGSAVPAGQSNQRLDATIAFDDPMFRAALASGVTTVLASGKDGGLLSGRVTAVKTGAKDQQHAIVRAICAQRTVFDALGPDAEKPLRDALERARTYAKTWADYDKAMQEYKAGKKPAVAKPPTPAPADGEAKVDPISGTWKAELDLQGRFQIQVTLELQLAGDKVTGKVKLALGQRELPEQTVESGSWDGTRMKLVFRGMGGEATVEGTVKDDAFDGTIALGPMGDQPLTAKRVAKGSGESKPAGTSDDEPSDAPKKPELDQGQEPLRAVVEGRATLVVRVQRLPAVKAVVELLEKEQVAYALHGADSLLDDASVLGPARPFVLLEPEVVREDGAELVNAAARLCDLDLPVVFGTGDCAGTRYLPLHAAYAVRYGMPSDQALAAITSHAARAFRLDDRIGSLQRGRDADFVVFSGDPFEPQSRVLLVACNGEIAVDNREVFK